MNSRRDADYGVERLLFTSQIEEPRESRAPQKYRVLQFAVGSFGLCSLLLTESSTLDPFMSCGRNFAKYCMEEPDRLSALLDANLHCVNQNFFNKSRKVII